MQRTCNELELIEIRTQKAKRIHRLAIFLRLAIGLGDVDSLLAKGLADGGQDARLVGSDNAQLHGAIDARIGVPRDLDTSLRIGIKSFDTAFAVNRESATTRHKSHDVVARQRVATLGMAHEHIFDAAQSYAAVVDLLHGLSNHASQGALAKCRRRRRVETVFFGRKQLDHIVCVHTPVADAHKEFLEVVHLERLDHTSHIVIALLPLGHGEPSLRQIAIQKLAPDTKGFLSLLLTQKAANLGACAGSDDVVEPVLARLLRRLRDNLDHIAAAQFVLE